MANFFDISAWQEKQHFNTGGTRNKQVVEHPETFDLYFFKTSLKKEKIDYKYEFWSEIIASEIGTCLGFNMLGYEIAFRKDEIGCLSKLMINPNDEKLNEGVNYLRGHNPNYDPEDKSRYNEYTFSFIHEALKEYKIEFAINDIIKVIIFDSIIGNSDRHQENWGFIIPNLNLDEKLKNNSLDNKFVKWLIKKLISKDTNKILNTIKGMFSPIYDSGSCLGREIEDDKVELMFKDNIMLEAYINRGTAEIRWEGKRLNHFELIRKIKKGYDTVVTDEINRINKIFSEQRIRKIVLDIDNTLPENLKQFKLPQKRKELIIKMITLRFQKLKEIIT